MKKDQYSTIFDISRILDGLDSEDAIIAFLDSLRRLPQHFYINETILFHREGSESLAGHLKKNFSHHFISENPIKLLINNKEDKSIFDDLRIPIFFLKGSQENIYKAISISKTSGWDIVNRRFIKKLYPKLIPVFFKQSEIEKAFTSLKFELGSNYRIQVSDLTLKEKRSGSSNNMLNKTDTKRWWTNKSIEEVFSLAKDQSLWFTSLKFSIERISNKEGYYQRITTGRISKFGRLYFNNTYTAINNSLVFELERSAYKRLSLFMNRSLGERPINNNRAIQITYPYDIFSEKNDIVNFGKILSQYPNSSRVDYHINPYYHSNIADFIDGSSFDVWITSPHKMVIIPQIKSTEIAFERLTTYIFSGFGEGIVDDFTVN